MLTAAVKEPPAVAMLVARTLVSSFIVTVLPGVKPEPETVSDDPGVALVEDEDNVG